MPDFAQRPPPLHHRTPWGFTLKQTALESKQGYVPYRDSKLTRLLQPSLGGNAQITIICTVTAALLSVEETHNTLKFANRAKRIKNHASINEVSNEKVKFWL